MRAYLKKQPIAFQLSMLIFLIVMTMLTIMAANYARSVEAVKRDNSHYINGTIAQLKQTVSANSRDIVKVLNTVAYNGQTVQRYFHVTDPVERYEAYLQIKSYLSDMMGMKDCILDIGLTGINGTNVNLEADRNRMAALAGEIPPKTLYYYLGFKEVAFSNETLPVFVVGAPIYSTNNFNQGNNQLGIVLMALDIKALMDSYVPAQLINGATLYMSDRYGHVFYTNDSSIRLGSQLSEDLLEGSNRHYIIQKDVIPDIGGEVIIKMPNRVLLRGLNEIRMQQLMMVGIALVLLIVPFLFVINNILQPLKKLMRLMSEVRLGQRSYLSKRIEVDGYAEMIIMTTRFNEMMAEINELTDRLLESERLLYEAELVKRRAELSYLQSQINPHFLYNTLESIKGLAVDEGANKIFELAKALGLFFRFSIKGPDMVMMEKEMTIIRSYIYIHQIRFGERLKVEYDIAEECLTCMIPKMILQPLVENAIYHGIEPLRRNGELLIRGYTDNRNLYLIIQDNGSGISMERLSELQQSIERRATERGLEDDHGEGIGLINVQDRIRIKFGDEYGLRISSSQLDSGTQVLLKMPIRRET